VLEKSQEATRILTWSIVRVAVYSVLFPVFLVAAGCAPGRYVEGVQFTADRYGVRGAETLCVAHRGHLRFDHALQSDLDDVLATGELEHLQADGARVLEDAHALAVEAVDAEIDRMPSAGLDELVRRYRLSSAPPDAEGRRAFLKETFAARSRTLLDRDVSRLRSAHDVRAATRFLRAVRRGIEPPPGDRGKVARVLLGAPLFLPAAIGAEVADARASERVLLADFEHVIKYEPPSKDAAPSAAMLKTAEPPSLAAWYAPTLVQQVAPEAEYAAEDDRIGQIYLTGAPGDVKVHVDTTTPVVYWAHRQAKVEDRRYDQLVYVAWYPRRPEMSANDPSAGHIDGVVIRITLDRHHRPAIYEFVRSCGCYHTLWVAEFVEAAAREEFGPPGEHQRYSVQRTDVGRELFLPALVRDDGAHPRRPIAFVSAGYHMVMGIHPLDDERPPGAVDKELAYALEPYENLTRLPLGNGVASMFGADGLVHDAGRAEGWLLAPTGMLSAGQPRQLGTMKVRMDAYDYDDPRLLERNLRLPGSF
jgi:hypothetical protein